MTTETLQRTALTLGFGAAFVSAAGQSFFIGLFGPAVQADLAIGASAWGTLYGLATLAGGLAMFGLGALVDRVRPLAALALALGLLATGALLMAAVQGVWTMLAALLCLRLGGQGLSGHLAIVVAARYAVARGRGVAIAAYGFIVSEAMLPPLLVTLLAVWSWRGLWAGIGATILLVALPLLGRLASRLPAPTPRASGPPTTLDPTLHRTPPQPPGQAPRQAHVPPPAHASPLRRRDLLRDTRFRLALLVMMVPPVVVTAVFVQQGPLGAALGWDARGAAWAMSAFATAQAVSTWLSGRWVDRHGAHGLLRVYLWPLAVGTALLAWPMLAPAGTGEPVAWPWWVLFAGLGATGGGQSVLSGALWVELYGTASVGAVRGTYVSLMVLATALAPPALGMVLDAGWPPSLLAAGVLVYVGLASSAAARRLARGPQPPAAWS